MIPDFDGILQDFNNSTSKELNNDLDLLLQKQELSHRDATYSDFLSNYVQDFKWKRWTKLIMKIIFFVVVIGGGVCLSYGCFGLANKLIAQENISPSTLVAGLISSISAVITSIVAIPLAIAKYLFNPTEDEKIADIIGQMQDHDLESQKMLSSYTKISK